MCDTWVESACPHGSRHRSTEGVESLEEYLSNNMLLLSHSQHRGSRHPLTLVTRHACPSQWELCPSDITRDMLTAPHPRRHVPGGGNHTMADRGAAARVLYARLHMHTLGAGGEIRVRHTAWASVTTGLYRATALPLGSSDVIMPASRLP